VDWPTFITEIVKALVWPATILTIIALFKRPIATLLSEVGRLKWKGLEIEFEKDIKEIAKRADEVLPPQLVEVRAADEIKISADEMSFIVSRAENEKITRLAEISPPAAILEVWLDVESALREAASRHEVQVSPRTHVLSLARNLVDMGKLDQQTFEIFETLRDLRNKVVHARSTDLTFSQAMEFGAIGSRLASKLRAL